MSFDEAAVLFEDDFFDFVYVDGAAHTGQENGQTLRDWYPKVKPGGIFSGHDYHSDWPQTIKAVDEFVASKGLEFYLIECREQKGHEGFPTWFVIKPLSPPV